MTGKYLIINADGYGITPGINRAIEECIAFGTVTSISVNVNFQNAEQLNSLINKFPQISVGCHLNPIIGEPVLTKMRVKSLVNDDGEFFYKDFNKRLYYGAIDSEELKAELFAQVDRCRQLAGPCFSHVDFHMGKHRLPKIYPIFLEVAHYSGAGRIRTHKYKMAMECSNPFIGRLEYYLKHPIRIAIFGWNLWLRHKAKQQNFSMPDWRLGISDMGTKPGTISLNSWKALLRNVPQGISEFVVHPAYLDNGLKKYSTYLQQRNEERKILLSAKFKECLSRSQVELAGYRDIK